MILHVSLPADDCANVARVLAELMRGAALPFPPGGPSAWNAWSEDASVQIVVTPRGQVMVPGSADMEWRTGDIHARSYESHVALSVPLTNAQILAVAEREDWPARVAARGDFFSAVELWVEGCYLVELLDPSSARQYRESMTIENWMRHFGVSGAPS